MTIPCLEPGRRAILDLKEKIVESIEAAAKSCLNFAPSMARQTWSDLFLLYNSVISQSVLTEQDLQSLHQLLGVTGVEYCECVIYRNVSGLIQATAAYPFPLREHTDTVTSVAFLSHDKIVSGSWDGTLCIWNINTGELVGEPLRGHTDWVHSVAVAPDGRRVASGSDDDTIRIWELDDAGKFVHAAHVMRAHGMWGVLAVAFSPCGERIVSGSNDGAVRLWDAVSGHQIGEA